MASGKEQHVAKFKQLIASLNPQSPSKEKGTLSFVTFYVL
jgi:hypothetical protein